MKYIVLLKNSETKILNYDLHGIISIRTEATKQFQFILGNKIYGQVTIVMGIRFMHLSGSLCRLLLDVIFRFTEE